MREFAADGPSGDEWAEWGKLTPEERFLESMKLWETYLALGGSPEPEPDTQSPFFDPEEWRENAAHLRPGVRVTARRSLAGIWMFWCWFKTRNWIAFAAR
jgi:hypothetical protein